MCTWVSLIPWSENELQIFRPLTPEDQNPSDQGKKKAWRFGEKNGRFIDRVKKELNSIHHNFSVYQCKILCESNREINLICKLQNSVHPWFRVSAHYFVLRLFLWNSLTTPLQDSTCGMVQFSQGYWLHGQLTWRLPDSMIICSLSCFSSQYWTMAPHQHCCGARLKQVL